MPSTTTTSAATKNHDDKDGNDHSHIQSYHYIRNNSATKSNHKIDFSYLRTEDSNKCLLNTNHDNDFIVLSSFEIGSDNEQQNNIIKHSVVTDIDDNDVDSNCYSHVNSGSYANDDSDDDFSEHVHNHHGYHYHADDVENNADDDDDDDDEEELWENTSTLQHKILLHDVWTVNNECGMEQVVNRLWKIYIPWMDSMDYYSSNNALKVTSRSSSSIEDIKHKQEKQKKQQIEIFYKLGGYAILVGIMNQYLSNYKIQARCCSIWSILCNNHNHKDLIEKAIYANVIQSIIQSLIQFPSNMQIQYQACSALKKLTDHHHFNACTKIMSKFHPDNEDSEGSKNNMKNRVENNNYVTNGLYYIIQAMKTFPKHHRIQYSGCCILYSISYYDEYLNDIRFAGAVVVLANAIENHADHLHIQEIASKTMMQLLLE